MNIKVKLCFGCGNQKHIWKNVMTDAGRKRLCKECANSCKTIVHKPTPKNSIASHSAKRTKQETEYNKRARIFKEEHPLCQIGIPGRCTHKTVDVHHEGGKENDLLLKEEWWRAVCRPCHEWVTINTEAAIELGYSRQRTTNSNN